MFSLLLASNYHYNKGPVCYVFPLYSEYLLGQVINIVLIYSIMRYTCLDIFSTIFHWPTIIILFLSCLILNCHGYLLFSQELNLFICGIFEHNNSSSDKEIHNLWFFIINIKSRNQITLTQTKQPLKEKALSEGGWSLWGWSWLRHKSPGFR